MLQHSDVIYSVKQLTAGCVDETSIHFGFVVKNDYDTRFIEYNELNQVSHWLSLSDELCLLSAYQRSAEMNEQLSRRNSLLSVELCELLFFPRIEVCLSANC